MSPPQVTPLMSQLERKARAFRFGPGGGFGLGFGLGRYFQARAGVGLGLGFGFRRGRRSGCVRKKWAWARSLSHSLEFQGLGRA